MWTATLPESVDVMNVCVQGTNGALPPSTPAPTDNGGGSGSGLDAGVIIGIVVSVAGTVVTAIGVVVQYLYRKGHPKQPKQQHAGDIHLP